MPISTIPLSWTNPPEGSPGHSSQIAGYGYDAETKTLAIEFESNKDRITYHYPNTPPEKFAELESAPSKGSWFYAHKNSTLKQFDRLFKDDVPTS